MEIREVRYDPNTEYKLVHADCEYCNHEWRPYNVDKRLPLEVKLKCPNCGKMNLLFWADSKMNREILHKKYVLNYDNEINNAKTKIKKLTKERDELKERYENESENTRLLAKAINRLAEKLEQLGIEVNDNDKNPLSS